MKIPCGKTAEYLNVRNCSLSYSLANPAASKLPDNLKYLVLVILNLFQNLVFSMYYIYDRS